MHNIGIQGDRQNEKEQERINNRSTAVPNSLEELVELAGQGVLEVGVEPVKGVLPQVGHLVP